MGLQQAMPGLSGLCPINTEALSCLLQQHLHGDAAAGGSAASVHSAAGLLHVSQLWLNAWRACHEAAESVNCP